MKSRVFKKISPYFGLKKPNMRPTHLFYVSMVVPSCTIIPLIGGMWGVHN